ncbi:hypothetical protein [Methylophaga sp.]|uniref:hypothetical protein n=1 Tax=Methylophaga sp. TaxID=2024840 RepID=UPI003A95BE88
MENKNKTVWQIFRMPIFIGLVSAIGLILALLGDGLLDFLSWLLLLIPVVACMKTLKRKTKTP